MTTIAITGATGNVGAELARLLLAGGVGVRAIGRSAERLADLARRGADPRVGSVEDPAFLAAAFRGADAVWAMIPPSYDSPDPRGHQTRVADAIAAALQVSRVPRVVALSSVGADQPRGNGPIAGLHYLEQRLNQVPGLRAVHLRPGYFMENFLGSIGLIKSAGINGSHFQADLPMAMVATRDIAHAAAGLLGAPAFDGQAVRELQGPRDYTMREATTILGQAIGRPDLPYVEFPADAMRDGLIGAGFSAPMAGLFVEMAEGFNARRTRMLQPRTAGTSTPTTLEQFAREAFAPHFGP